MTVEMKLKLAINALTTIRNWDDECDELWSDPGECAKETLDRINN